MLRPQHREATTLVCMCVSCRYSPIKCPVGVPCLAPRTRPKAAREKINTGIFSSFQVLWVLLIPCAGLQAEGKHSERDVPRPRGRLDPPVVFQGSTRKKEESGWTTSQNTNSEDKPKNLTY